MQFRAVSGQAPVLGPGSHPATQAPWEPAVSPLISAPIVHDVMSHPHPPHRACTPPAPVSACRPWEATRGQGAAGGGRAEKGGTRGPVTCSVPGAASMHARQPVPAASAPVSGSLPSPGEPWGHPNTPFPSRRPLYISPALGNSMWDSPALCPEWPCPAWPALCPRCPHLHPLIRPLCPPRLEGSIPEGVKVKGDVLVFQRPLSVSDTGVYVCRVANSFATKEAWANVSIKGRVSGVASWGALGVGGVQRGLWLCMEEAGPRIILGTSLVCAAPCHHM